MREIEERLRELGDATRSERWDGPMAASAMRRIRRRRAVAPVTGAVAVAVAAAAVVSLAAPTRGRDVRRAAAGSSAAQGAPQQPAQDVPSEGFAAIWPEDNHADATEGCTEAAGTPGSFRADPTETGLAFAREVLGWDTATATSRAVGDASYEVDLRYAGEDGRPEYAVTASLVEVVDGCWSVERVPHRSDEVLAIKKALDPKGGETTASFGMDLPDAAGGEVEVGYGGSVWRQRWSGPLTNGDWVEVRLGAASEIEGTTGHYLVLIEDAEGVVMAAAGAPLLAATGEDLAPGTTP